MPKATLAADDVPETTDLRSPEGAEAVALARRASGGDAAATAQLLRKIAPRVVRVASAVLGRSHADVEDVAQQALIAFIQALPAFRGDSDPARYATTIAVRTAIAARRRSRADHARRDAGAETDQVASRGAEAPSEELASKRRKDMLRVLLAEIPAEQAEALAMRVVLGWSLEEIAEQSGAPLNTVRSRLRLAKESLRRSIEAEPHLLDELGPKP